MNEAQKSTLEKLPGWEVQRADRSYIQIGYILPDGRFINATDGPTIEVATHPDGTIIVGKSA